VVLSKKDSVSSPERVERFKKLFEARGFQVAVISSVTGEGIPELVEMLAQRVFMTA
jgi:putative ribosome biogenesis GTPase RsgA